ncbi:MAG: tetratricopeptide repeat protein [Lepagella sp.]
MSYPHISAKLLLGTYLLLSFLFTPLASFASADKVESLISSFEKSSDKVNVTNDFFNQLRKEGFIDDNTSFKKDTPIDSIRQQFYYWAGEWYCEQQNYQLSKEYGLKALPLFHGASIAKSDCLNLLGVVCVRMGDFASGINYTKQCLDITLKSGNDKLIAATYSTLAGTYIAANDPNAAIKYILEGLKYADKVEDTTYKGILMGMASEAYHKSGDDTKALEYAEEGYKVDSIAGRKKRMAIRLSQKANALFGLERYAEAEATFRQAFPILQEVGNYHSLAIDYNQLGFALLKQKRNAEAINYFREADRLLGEMGDLYNQLHSKRGLYESYWTVNQDSAYAAMTSFNQLKDTLYSQASADALARYKVEFDTDRLQEEVNQHQTRRVVWSIIGAFLVLILIIGWIFHRRRVNHYRREMKSLVAKIYEYQQQNNVEEETSDVTELERRVIEAVNEGMPSGKFSVADIALSLNMGEQTFRRRFVEATGKLPKAFITSIQMSKAVTLLKDCPDMPIAEVARECGFDELSALSRTFKKSFGCSPTEYRAKLG